MIPGSTLNRDGGSDGIPTQVYRYLTTGYTVAGARLCLGSLSGLLRTIQLQQQVGACGAWRGARSADKKSVRIYLPSLTRTPCICLLTMRPAGRSCDRRWIPFPVGYAGKPNLRTHTQTGRRPQLLATPLRVWILLRSSLPLQAGFSPTPSVPRSSRQIRERLTELQRLRKRRTNQLITFRRRAS
jgi:hypothetical protein